MRLVNPEILFNIGRCHEELKETDDAIYHYEMYLRFYPEAQDAQDVKHRIGVLREVQARDSEQVEESTEEAEELYEEEAFEEEKSDGGIRLGGSLGFGIPITGE